jgi:hypothetical protein
MTFDDFIKENDGKGIDWDGAFSTQCMDLAHAYASKVVGQDFPPAPAAKDVWGKSCPGYDKISNTPEGVPQKGDIVIWGTDIGPYGHIAVFIDGNTSTFTSFDQNFPINSLCHKQSHNYKGVLGWLRPKTILGDAVTISKTDFENLMTKATQWDVVADKEKIDKLDKGGGQKVVEEIIKLEESVTHWQEEYNKLKNQVPVETPPVAPESPPEPVSTPEPPVDLPTETPITDLPTIAKDDILSIVLKFLFGWIFGKK